MKNRHPSTRRPPCEREASGGETPPLRRIHGRGSTSRRAFLGGCVSGGIAFPALVHASALGRSGAAAAGERITLGFIGVGRMGQGHVWTALQHPGAQIVAVCDVDRWRRTHAKARVEQAYADRSGRTYRGCAAYKDLRELLARDDIDAVLIATGDRWNVPAGILAAKAGKDVYCEKPLSLTIREARAMVEAARRYGTVCQVGLQQRSTPEFQAACRWVREGRIGRVDVVYVGFPGTNRDVNLPAEPVPEGLDWDRWLGPAPWRPFNGRFHHYGQPRVVIPWNFCRDFGGGNLTANAVHAFDVVQWGLGMDEKGPVEIIPPETGKVPCLTYRYASGVRLQVTWKLDPKVHAMPAGWNANERIQNFGALFVGEKGWIHVGRAGYLRAHPASLIDPRPEPLHVSSVLAHHRNWLSCIRTRKRPACDVAIGAHSTIVSHLGCIAHWTGRTLRWDPVEEAFVGDEEADRLRALAKRAPWRI